jgi:hypothetical protein
LNSIETTIEGGDPFDPMVQHHCDMHRVASRDALGFDEQVAGSIGVTQRDAKHHWTDLDKEIIDPLYEIKSAQGRER